MPTNVTLLLKGSLVLSAKKGQPTGTVAILRQPPPRHVLKIQYRVQPPGGVFGPLINVPLIQDALSVEVQNSAHPNITLRDEAATINRLQAPTNQDSYKWFVDLENSELYGSTIGAIKDAFKQFLTFNSGELFTPTRGISYNKLQVQRGSNSDYETFGFVAGTIGVEFSLADKVVFKNGGVPVFDSSDPPPGTNYRIELENDAPPNSIIVADANHYYKAVGSGIPQERKILFASVVEDQRLKIMLQHYLEGLLEEARSAGDRTHIAVLEKLLRETPPAGPEAACFPAYLSRTDPSQ